jgi:hypothetical protein
MPGTILKVIFKDMQDKVPYRAIIEAPLDIRQTVEITLLDLKPRKVVKIRNIRGFLQSDTGEIVYLMDSSGKRYMLRTIS